MFSSHTYNSTFKRSDQSKDFIPWIKSFDWNPKERGATEMTISNTTYAQIMRDYNHTCAACGCRSAHNLCVDHVHPRSAGGSDDADNLQCKHQTKGCMEIC